MKNLIVCLILSLSWSAWGQEEKSLEQLQADLSKINQSVEVTRQKMRDVRDVTFLPDLYFVLAELYVEKSRYQAAITRKKEPNTPINELDFSDARKSKKQAIEVYQRILEVFPKADFRDRALFYMAHEYREMGALEEMVKTYIRLTTEFNKSQFWEESQLVLGDYFLEQKKDPEIAREVYQKILNRPQNPFMGLARYKLGWCLINMEKFKEALDAFENVITVDSKIPNDNLPDFYKKNDIRRDALIAMVWPYSEQKKLDPFRANALKYFESLSPNRQSLVKVLDKLTKRLMLKERVEDTVPLYIRMISLTNSLEYRLEYIDRFYEVLRKSKRQWPLENLPEELAVTLLRVRHSVDIASAEVTKHQKNYEVYLRDISTRLQKLAQSSKQETAYLAAIRAYEYYLSLYPNTKFTNDIMLNLSESYFAIKKHARAGYYYEKLFARNKKKEVLDSAIQSFALALKEPDKLPKIELAESRMGFRASGRQFIKSYPGDKANAMISFNIARTYYDERVFDRAVKGFFDFINAYPNHSEITTAGNLILDSFNQREDYDGLIKAGKQIIANPRVRNAQFKQDVQEIIRQAEYRKVQDVAGDPKSRDYAKNLLKFADKYKGSALGDQALYEAFVSMKAKKDPEAYSVGEQLITRFSDSKYAQEVVGAMGQMAINTADYRRAAQYFEMFARKYPKDPNSPALLKNAATMRELLGDTQAAADNYRDLGDPVRVARQYAQAQEWGKVAQVLTGKGTGGLEASYLLGVALYRQGQTQQAKSYLFQASRAGASSYEDKKMAAHALYLINSQALNEYKNIRLGSGQNEAELVKLKSAKLNELTQQFNSVISFGNGRWTIAALYQIGRAHTEFGQFITGAAMPAGLNQAQQQQYRQLIGQQAQGFNTKASAYYKACLDNAEKFEVFTRFVRGCQSQGAEEIDEATEERTYSREGGGDSPSIKSLRAKLYDSPRNVDLLMQLVQAYLQNQDYPLARVVLNRILEIKPDWAKAEALVGQVFMFMNDLESAHQSFKVALSHNSREPLALWGIAALYKEFGFGRKLGPMKAKAKASGRPSGVLHTWISSL
ncbi:MAG: tetratricopeptide repeat protein [Oligoflexia bacterium]|nr:tetratricopeptide repeat protein [Oligoflexia bacterium]